MPNWAKVLKHAREIKANTMKPLSAEKPEHYLEKTAAEVAAQKLDPPDPADVKAMLEQTRTTGQRTAAYHLYSHQTVKKNIDGMAEEAKAAMQTLKDLEAERAKFPKRKAEEGQSVNDSLERAIWKAERDVVNYAERLRKLEKEARYHTTQFRASAMQAELAGIHNPEGERLARLNPKRAQAFRTWYRESPLRSKEGHPMVFLRAGEFSGPDAENLWGAGAAQLAERANVYRSTVDPHEIGTHAGDVGAAMFVAEIRVGRAAADPTHLLKDGAKVRPVGTNAYFANFQNPLVIADGGWDPVSFLSRLLRIEGKYPGYWDEKALQKLQEATDKFEHRMEYAVDSDLFMSHAKYYKEHLIPFLEEHGHDGIVYMNGAENPGNLSIINFHADQIKSIHAKEFKLGEKDYLKGAMAAPIATAPVLPKEAENVLPNDVEQPVTDESMDRIRAQLKGQQ